MRDGRPSPTRANTDHLRNGLKAFGVKDIVETNVIRYATPMSNDLADKKHTGGRAVGRQVFLELLAIIRPRVTIARGVRTRKELVRAMAVRLPAAAPHTSPAVANEQVKTRLLKRPYAPLVIVIRSLAPPEWNRWQPWASAHMDETCALTGRVLARP